MLFDCFALVSASFLISSATTANPFPAIPAWADSIIAFIERRFVCEEIEEMILFVSWSDLLWSRTIWRSSFTAAFFSIPSAVATFSSLNSSDILPIEAETVLILPIISSILALASVIADACWVIRSLSSLMFVEIWVTAALVSSTHASSLLSISVASAISFEIFWIWILVSPSRVLTFSKLTLSAVFASPIFFTVEWTLSTNSLTDFFTCEISLLW